ncbi:MAG: DUF2971 domain-containing protein [Flavobacterium sp.]|nr:MAG: DUF2971 domain-containing protein [Flavobacterium sp.]
MYLYQQDFILPKNPKAKLWRFMDLYKFIAMLETSSLYFTRADNFKDPFEGTFPEYNSKQRAKHYYNYDASEAMFENRNILFDRTRKHTVINCWHLNQFESAAMWELYSNRLAGIAIETTVFNFKECFRPALEEILIGKVKYLDFKRQWMSEHHFGQLYLHKRKGFKHENEVRAFITHDLNQINKNEVAEFEKGINVKVDLNTLIRNIYLHPDTSESFIDILKGLMKKYNITKPVLKSKLYDLV